MSIDISKYFVVYFIVCFAVKIIGFFVHKAGLLYSGFIAIVIMYRKNIFEDSLLGGMSNQRTLYDAGCALRHAARNKSPLKGQSGKEDFL